MWRTVIIDDDPKVLQGMKRAIPWAELGAAWAGEARDGAQGLQLIGEVQPAIILTDIYMPVMNGLEMIESLRTSGFAGKIIILSGYSDFQYARTALRLNVDDYLSKPVTIQTMSEVLAGAIGGLEAESRQHREQARLEQRLLLAEPFVTREWVKAVVTGTAAPVLSHLPEVAMLQERWSAQCHLAVAIRIVRRQPATGPLGPMPGGYDEEAEQLTEALQAEVYAVTEACDAIELHGQWHVLVLHGEYEAAEALHEQATDLRERLLRRASDFPAFSVCIGTGGWKAGWQAIADSAEEAFASIAAQDGWLHTAEAGNSTAQAAAGVRRAAGPVKFCHQLVAGLYQSQRALVQESLEQYREQLREQELSNADLLMLGSEIWGILTYSLQDVGIVLDELFPELDLKRELGELEDAGQLMDWLAAKAEAICSSRERGDNLKHKQAVDYVIAYLNEHYAENVTLQDLSNQLYISRYYLGQIFKKATGESFNHYLTKVRMAKAREMILEGRLLIYEVAERVGFRNVPYFSTLFKRHTGLNPTDLLK
ncbi:response regulator transcription factor [Paenibacillus sp. 1P07SE]|uniref:response regulator transcription factor n=1 Tax=Paenibacillus sp. 1P07SE TaxID=3132209 RepID=UPI0039A54B49